MQRVMIVGAPGSGKSTLARSLGQRTGLPVYHMDHIHWRSGWEERSRGEKTKMAREVEARPKWIFEGGHSATYETRLERADVLVWLDLPVSLRMWRVTKRLIRYWGQERPDMAQGCTEGFHRETIPFYGFIWQTRHRAREKVQALLDNLPETKQFYHLRSPAEVLQWLDGISLQ